MKIVYLLKSGLSAKLYGLIGLMVYCIVLSVINSAQMCQLADSLVDTTNTLFLIFTFVSIVPLHFSTPSMFLTTFFPMDLFPFLFGIMKMPSIIFMFLNKPLFGMIIQGDDIIDADFCPVSIGLGIAAGFPIILVIYIFNQGRKMLKNTENDEEDVNLIKV